MSEDWRGDPFADENDPQAEAREQRRREREERRRQREEKQAADDAAAPAPVAEPAPPSRTPEEDFWDETPATEGRAAGTQPAAANEPAAAKEPRVKRSSRARWQGRGPNAVAGGSSAVLGAMRRHPLRFLGALGGLLTLWLVIALFQPFHGDGSGRVVVAIPKGASVAEVGDLLDREGVVSSSTLFQLRVTMAGKRSELYPGRFVLAGGMSYGAAIDALSTAPVKATTTLTIPEGYSRAQTAAVAEQAGLTGSYLQASTQSKYLNPADYGGKGAKDLEGFLFPDTFELKPNAPAADLVQLQLQDFKRRIKGVDMRYARSKNLTTYDVVTIASMVEREAQLDSERPLIAAVIYNRLHEGMSLGIDATIRFATGNYTQPLTESELAIDSPYNTRLYSGLPPGPINSPGLASIEAAAHPAKVDHLFYVVKPGTCGEHSFSSTDAQFQADVARYNSARDAAGGESPDSCG